MASQVSFVRSHALAVTGLGKHRIYKRRFSTSGPSTPTNTIKEGGISVCIGLLAGSLGSMIGLGGSFIALPMLTGLLKMQQNLAHGTGLATVLCTSLGGTLAYIATSNKNGSSGKSTIQLLKDMVEKGVIPDKVGDVDVITALCLSAASSITVVRGAQFSKTMSPYALKLSMGCLLLFVSPLVPLREHLQKTMPPASALQTTTESLYNKAASSLVIGSFAGVLAGIFGVGGGAIQIPALCLFTDIDYHTALGTSLAAMMPLAVVGSATHLRQKTMVPRIALPLGIGSLIGSFLGGTQAKGIDTEQLKIMFPLVMAALGINGIFQARRLIRK